MKIYVKDVQTIFKATHQKNLVCHYSYIAVRYSGKFKGLTHIKARLGVLDSSKQCGRRSSSMTNLDGSRRKIAAVCYHGHYDFMAAIFEKEPDAVIITAMERYEGKADFEDKAPVNFGDACECERGAC